MKRPASTWMDRAVGALAPRWQLNRLRARVASDLLLRNYEGASVGRRTQGWTKVSTDASAATSPFVGRLRDVARDLVRNNPHAESALTTIVDHAVGWGIVAKPAPANKRAADAWDAWANTTACDADGRHDFAGIQKLVMRTVAEAGEVLVRRRFRLPEDNLPIPLQLQVLEPDFLDTAKHGFTLPNGGRIVYGVEFDAIGRRTAYWLFPEHPGSTAFTTTASQRVPAEGVLHVYKATRPGAVRAASWFAPVLLRFKDFDEYEDATLMKQKIAACLAVITTDVDGTGSALGTADDTNNPGIDNLGPGAVINAPLGRDITVVQPPSVADYQEYSQVSLRAIAAGLGVTYEDMTGDYCMAPETRVLSGDLRWVRADELREGDAIVAFDENKPSGKGQRRKWRQAMVTAAGRRDLPRVRIVTDKTSVTVSAEHQFLCVGTQGLRWNPKVGYGHVWVRADELKPGDRIAFLAEPWAEGQSHTHGYLKGIADGEGCVDKDSAHIGIAQNPGVVFDEIGAALTSLGFSPRLGKANGQRNTDQWELFGTADCLRFLGEVRPTRLLTKSTAIYDGKAMSGGKGKQGMQCHATVQSADAEGVGPVVTLSTSTATVITEGLCSHNTQMPFSAARMSRLRHWARVEDWRWRMMIPQFCDPVWRWAMQAAVVAGVTNTMPDAEWTAPPMPMIDPSAEGLAYQRNVRAGIMTLSEAIRERGYDPEALFAEMAADNKKLDQLGLILDSDPRQMTQAGQAQGTAKDGAPPAEDVQRLFREWLATEGADQMLALFSGAGGRRR